MNDNRLKAVASNLRRLQGGSGTDGEIVIADSLLHILRGNVLHDYFVRDIARTGHNGLVDGVGPRHVYEIALLQY